MFAVWSSWHASGMCVHDWTAQSHASCASMCVSIQWLASCALQGGSAWSMCWCPCNHVCLARCALQDDSASVVMSLASCALQVVNASMVALHCMHCEPCCTGVIIQHVGTCFCFQFDLHTWGLTHVLCMSVSTDCSLTRHCIQLPINMSKHVAIQHH